MANSHIMDKIPVTGLPAEKAYRLIQEKLSFDSDPAVNLGTFSTSFMEAEAEELFQQAIGKNFIDQHAYPNLEAIHQQVISMLGQLFHAPQHFHPIGTSTAGSSEAIMLGLLAHKFSWRNRRQMAGKPTDKPNIVMGGNVHVCWKKFALYFDVASRTIPSQNEECILTAEQVAEAIDENTIAVSCILGNTYTGQIDEIEKINELLVKIKRDQGWDIPIHVDAAIGGFVIPFIHPELAWDFRLEQVRSINVSNHKFGLIYPGMGSLLFRDRTVLPDELIFEISYLGNTISNYSLNFSRPSSMVLLQYYNFLRFGISGYTDIIEKLISNTQLLEAKLWSTSYFDVISDSRYLPMVVARLKNEIAAKIDIYQISEIMRERNWTIPAYSLPIKANNNHVIRLVVKPNWTIEMINLIVQNLQEVICIILGY
ncbi:MAG: glutamate decarboxylase [Phormidium sp.]